MDDNNHVVKDYFSKQGCHIIIRDDYITTDEREIEKIKESIAQRYIEGLIAQNR